MTHPGPTGDSDHRPRPASDTPLHDQLLASLRLGPARSNANTPGMREDNFS